MAMFESVRCGIWLRYVYTRDIISEGRYGGYVTVMIAFNAAENTISE